MTDKSIWDKEIPVPERLIEYVDPGVRESNQSVKVPCGSPALLMAELPPGTQIEGITKHGASYWARAAKIDATDKSGNPSPFFIKVHQCEHGKNMVSAEHYAMSLLYKLVPEMVAEPVAWGAYKDEPETYFFVCRFRQLSGKIPSVTDFPRLVAEFHKRVKSETGEFGFPITMYGGRNPQTFPLCKSWEECFSRGLDKVFDMEEETQGPDEEMRQLREGLMTKVMPRLLRPLETEGRTLTRTLVHGDLWDGNASVDAATGLSGHPMFFDATPLYAYNEYELGPWWVRRHHMTGLYIGKYKEYYKPSEPAEDFDDRGALYALRFDLHSSSLYPGNLLFRDLVINTMRDLLKKYPLGYEGYLLEKGLTPKADVVAANAAAVEANRNIVAEVVQDTGGEGVDCQIQPLGSGERFQAEQAELPQAQA